MRVSAGNDDYGTMSAWYTFAALGLYPVTGKEWYYLGSPVHDYVRAGPGPPAPRRTA
jgi:putative alpha-1,2-mannosidase